MNDVNPDNPEQYVERLIRKAEIGDLSTIHFGVRVHLSNENTIRENAIEAGINTDSQSFWDEVERCTTTIENNCLRILSRSGLYVSSEGHDQTGALVASVWIDTPEEDRKLALLKAVINWADGDWPSTTSGTMNYAFGANTTHWLYAKTEDAAQFIDVTIEFTGTDALVEWMKLNLNEAAEANDPYDPENFLRRYRKRYYKLFFGSNFTEGTLVGVFNTIAAATAVAKERNLRKRAPHVWVVEETYPNAPEAVIVGSEPTGVVYDITTGYRVSEPRVTENADPRAISDLEVERHINALPQPPPDYTPCDKPCRVCGNVCTLVHRGAGRDSLIPGEHICQTCDMERFNRSISEEDISNREIERHIDALGRDICPNCRCDLNQPHTVIRSYVDRLGQVYPLAGHYELNDGAFTADVPPSDDLLANIVHCDLPADSDICAHCGKNALLRMESTNKTKMKTNDPNEREIEHYIDAIGLNMTVLKSDLEACGLVFNSATVWGKWLIFSGILLQPYQQSKTADQMRADITGVLNTFGITRYQLKISDDGRSYTLALLKAHFPSAVVSSLLESPTPKDDPERSIKRFIAAEIKAKRAKLNKTIDCAVADYENVLYRRGIDNARDADELVGEIADKWAQHAGYENGSDEYDWLVSALNDAAGESFPGDWEDYPQ